MNTFPYSIPVDRELLEAERNFLNYLIKETCPERLKEIDSLHVYARCGCGACPTVMFESEPRREMKKRILADCMGGEVETGLIGVILWEREGRIVELEGYPISERDVQAWPDIDTIKPFDIHC